MEREQQEIPDIKQQALAERLKMFQYSKKQSGLSAAISILQLIFVNTVRHIRKSSGNPLIGLATSLTQSAVMIIVFVFMFEILGLKGSAIRGDFVLYVMTGIFMFLTHNKAMAAVSGSEGATSPMMLHAPMNTAIAITSAALSCLYMQVFSMFVVLGAYALWVGGFEIDNMIGSFGMFLMSWASGSALGMVVLAAKPWAPKTINVIQTFYQRANMITSGKMFVANQMPGFIIAMFSWNPLFHCIDQTRGFAFKNYDPHHSSISYVVGFTLVFLAIGLLGEFFTRNRVSASWSARG